VVDERTLNDQNTADQQAQVNVGMDEFLSLLDDNQLDVVVRTVNMTTGVEVVSDVWDQTITTA
jgi:hypothetical protein